MLQGYEYIEPCCELAVAIIVSITADNSSNIINDCVILPVNPPAIYVQYSQSRVCVSTYTNNNNNSASIMRIVDYYKCITFQ